MVLVLIGWELRMRNRAWTERRDWLLDDWTRVLYSNIQSLGGAQFLQIGERPQENRSGAVLGSNLTKIKQNTYFQWIEL